MRAGGVTLKKIDYLCIVKLAKVITSLCLALLMFFCGTGAYYVHYCCHDCSSEGIMAVIEHKCHDIHKTDCTDCTTSQKGCHSESGAELSSHHGCCSIERISFDMESVSHSMLSIFAVETPLSKELFSYGLRPLVVNIVNKPLNYSLSGRDHLSLISVLLI